MSAKESDILHEVGDLFVLSTPRGYEVRRNGLGASTCDSTYPKDPGGLSLAIARAKYLANPPKGFRPGPRAK